METTKQERAILEEIIRKRSANKKKWAYLLLEVVDQKKTVDKTYGDIADWLTSEGLEIREEALGKLIWKTKKNLNAPGNSTTEKSKPVLKKSRAISELAILEKEKDSSERLPTSESQNNAPIDLSAELRRRTLERQKVDREKKSGFDAFDGL